MAPTVKRTRPLPSRGLLSRSKRVLWVAVASAVMIGGSAGSVLAAASVTNKDADRAHAAFIDAAEHVSSTLQLAIQHEEDLVYSAAGFVSGNPTATSADFGRWQAATQALRRYPELIGIGEAIIVPHAKLAAFAKSAASQGPFQIVPAGVRPFYCLLSSGVGRSAEAAFPAGLDLCASSAGIAGLAARDSGHAAYIPYGAGASTLLVVLSPVYRNGSQPTTVSARRAAFVGWVGMEIQPAVVLQRALQDYPEFAVTFTYNANGSHAVFESGSIPRGASVETANLLNGWTVRTYGLVSAPGLFGNPTAVIVLFGGVGAALLLAAFLLVLATGRSRALKLVHEKTDELRHKALHDSLTGLANRSLLMDRVEHLMARNMRNDKLAAALYVDLDGFKNVNDTLGHGAGDLLLEAVGQRLTSSLRDADTIARLGGDEFVVLLDDGSSSASPEFVAERLLEVIRQPFVLDGVKLPVLITASVGIAAGHRDNPEDLLRDADMALYQAKSAGKNCYSAFDAQMGTDLQRRNELEFDLRAALEQDQFVLQYQPIYDLDDLAVIGVEALLRWEHPTIGQIQPDEFIPLLESTGQIIEVGRWVLREACTQMAAWRALGHDLNVSVNVSGLQLDRNEIVEDVRNALEDSGLEPSALIIEITETALMRNVGASAERLGELKMLGIHIAIDDFGTGYSSLAYLQRFPVDSLKIDRSFVDAIVRTAESEALVRTLVQLGKDLGLKTLAEGVETTAQVDYLRTQNVDEIQGFLLAKPLTPQALERQILRPALSADLQSPGPA